MNGSIKTLGFAASLFAGAFALVSATTDASAGPFRRLGTGYCGSNDYVIATTTGELIFECTIPSDGYLEQDDVTTARVFIVGGTTPSEAKPCAQSPTSLAVTCGGYNDAVSGVVTLTDDELYPWDTPSWFPYVMVHLRPLSTFKGITLSTP